MNQVLNDKDLLTIIALKTNFFTQLSMLKVCKKWNSIIKQHIKFESINDWEDEFCFEPFFYVQDVYCDYDVPANFEWVGTLENEKPYIELSTMIKNTEAQYGVHKYNLVSTNINEVYFFQNGVHDEDEWYLFGKIEKTWFFMVASCDYTGFDCRGSIRFYFSDDPWSLIAFGMSNKSRRTFLEFFTD
jgi:hypothetical protein